MKIKHPLVQATIKKVKPFIYAVVIKNDYDRGMLFCRYQEYYESPIKGIRGKYFTLETFMKKYMEFRNMDSFTYPTDWHGYNIPSDKLLEANNLFMSSDHITEYDKIMGDIISYILDDVGDKNQPWYILGTDSLKSGVMDHEVAHGLYYTNPEYKKECDRLIKEVIEKPHYKTMKEGLIKLGYLKDKTIIDDEVQAYLSTGIHPYMNTPKNRNYIKLFETNFQKFDI